MEELKLEQCCFLCLKSPPDKVKREVEVDTDDSIDKDDEDVIFQLVSLGVIQKYLEINYNSPTPTNSTCGETEQVFKMCQECGIVASRLSLLCKQLIEIQLKLNFNLGQFHRKLVQGNRLLGTKDEDGIGGELQIHRKRTSLKCTFKFSKTSINLIMFEK